MTNTHQLKSDDSNGSSQLPIVTEFSGTITPQLSALIRQRRLTLGVSYQQLSQILHMHWSTLRKWEAGETTSCHGRHISRLRAFLSGEYDLKIRMTVERPNNLLSLWTNMTPQMHECMETAAKIYGLCSMRPEIGHQLIENMHQAINATIKLLLKTTQRELEQSSHQDS